MLLFNSVQVHQHEKKIFMTHAAASAHANLGFCCLGSVPITCTNTFTPLTEEVIKAFE